MVGPLDDRCPGGSVALVHVDTLVTEGLDVEPISSIGPTGDVEQVKEATLMLGGVCGQFGSVLRAILSDKHSCALFADEGILVVVGVDVELLVGSSTVDINH